MIKTVLDVQLVVINMLLKKKMNKMTRREEKENGKGNKNGNRKRTERS